MEHLGLDFVDYLPIFFLPQGSAWDEFIRVIKLKTKDPLTFFYRVCYICLICPILGGYTRWAQKPLGVFLAPINSLIVNDIK